MKTILGKIIVAGAAVLIASVVHKEVEKKCNTAKQTGYDKGHQDGINYALDTLESGKEEA